jgi:hypothetical protein
MLFFQEKPMLLMATSPGARGANVLEIAKKAFPFMEGKLLFIPSFEANFDTERCISNAELDNQLKEIVKTFNFSTLLF